MVEEESSESALAIGRRLVHVRGSRSQGDFAMAIGLHKNTLGRYERGERMPDASAIAAICRGTGVSYRWLVTGEGPLEESSQASDVVLVPQYDVKVDAGAGAEPVNEEEIGSVGFSREFLRQLGVRASDAALVTVRGDSMEPTLRPGDLVLVNRREASSVPRDGIYVLRIDGSLLVKRVQKLMGGIIQVASDNPSYHPFELRPTQESAIVGRVVWAGKRVG